MYNKNPEHFAGKIDRSFESMIPYFSLASLQHPFKNMLYGHFAKHRGVQLRGLE